MNLRRGWWILGIVAACAALAAWPAMAGEGYFSNTDGELTQSDLVTYTAAGVGGPADPSPRTAGYCDTGVIGYIEYLHMGAHRDGMDVAQITHVPAAGGSNTEILEAQYGRDSGFRVGVGYQFANCWDVAWNYTYFFTDGAAAITPGAADMVYPTQGLNLAFGGPLAVGSTFAAYSRLRYHVNDLEFGRWIRLDDSASLRLFGGFRWAIIDQSLTQTYTVPAGEAPGGTDILVGNANMDGYGIRLGTEGRMNLPSNFSLFGRFAGSVLAGHFNYAVSDTASAGGVALGTSTFRESTTQAVPVLEAAVGAGWTYNQLELSLGYEVNCWFNMGNRYTAFAAAPPTSNDLLLDGFFVRAAFTR